MRISDWSSDVCSSDLLRIPRHRVGTTDSGEKSLPVHVIVNQHAEITVTGPVRPPTHGQQAAKTSGNYRREPRDRARRSVYHGSPGETAPPYPRSASERRVACRRPPDPRP